MREISPGGILEVFLVIEHKKGANEKLSLHLFSNYFDCKCSRKSCDKTLISIDLVHGIEDLWDIVGPLSIEEGFRCDLRNVDLSVCGARDSNHLLGTGADLKSIKGLNGNLLARKAEEVSVFEAGAIGMMLGQCHVDCRPYRTRWCHPVRC